MLVQIKVCKINKNYKNGHNFSNKIFIQPILQKLCMLFLFIRKSINDLFNKKR